MPASSSAAEQGGSSAATGSSNSKNPLKGAVEILPDRLYYAALKTPPANPKILLRSRHKPNDKVPVKCFCIDEELVYWNFFLDFGPLNLGQLYRFTIKLNQLLQDPSIVILFYSTTEAAKRANATYLICAWQILELKRTPEQAMAGFLYYQNNDNNNSVPPEAQNGGPSRTSSNPPIYPLTSIGKATIKPLPYWHDASPVACTYELNLMHCLQGIVKARQFKFFDWDNFDVEEYEHYEQVENGDLNWICQDRIMAFAGPSFKKTISPEGYCTLAPSDYIPYFKEHGVALVVRLNKKNYQEKDFVNAGIKHLDQFYLDGSCPPMKILQTVLAAFEAVPKNKAFAVHCKAGLGRTGTCIGAYMMKHYRMTAQEVIGWMRICRPGMVIGPQQQFLEDLQPVMWQEGEMMRKIQPGVKSKPEKSSSKKKKSSSAYPDVDTPAAKEAVSGRPGQADGLLARRHRQQQQQTSTPTSKDKTKPVPITPDGPSASSRGSKPASSWIKSSS